MNVVRRYARAHDVHACVRQRVACLRVLTCGRYDTLLRAAPVAGDANRSSSSSDNSRGQTVGDDDDGGNEHGRSTNHGERGSVRDFEVTYDDDGDEVTVTDAGDFEEARLHFGAGKALVFSITKASSSAS